MIPFSVALAASALSSPPNRECREAGDLLGSLYSKTLGQNRPVCSPYCTLPVSCPLRLGLAIWRQAELADVASASSCLPRATLTPLFLVKAVCTHSGKRGQISVRHEGDKDSSRKLSAHVPSCPEDKHLCLLLSTCVAELFRHR